MKILLRHVALGILAALTASVLIGTEINRASGGASGPVHEVRLLTHERTSIPVGRASWDQFYAATRP